MAAALCLPLLPNQLRAFWAELAPPQHIVQIYEDDEQFLNTLEAFVTSGLESNEAVVVIATPHHRRLLEERLDQKGIGQLRAQLKGLYHPFDAEESLGRFMVDGRPDPQLFEAFLDQILTRTMRKASKVRAFGEMVALLWARGECGATVQLEHLWHRYCESKGFPLYCAYPRVGFTTDPSDSITQICECHSHVILDARVTKPE